MLRIHAIGGFRVEVGDEDRTPAAFDRAAALLAWLALNPGLHPRSAVAARFWPDVLDESARASLRSALWALRRQLGEEANGALVATRDRVGLGDDVWVDVGEAERLRPPDGSRRRSRSPRASSCRGSRTSGRSKPATSTEPARRPSSSSSLRLRGAGDRVAPQTSHGAPQRSTHSRRRPTVR